MPRLFTGLEIPQSVVRELTLLCSGLNGARWIPKENYHVTLRFIGDIDPPTAEDAAAAFAKIRARPFFARINGLGSFGGRKPRALWAAVEGGPDLGALYKANESAARAAGLPPETRKFIPHVTLARLNGQSPQRVAAYLEEKGGFSTLPFDVDRFVLYSSRPGTGGGPYVIEEVYPLRNDFSSTTLGVPLESGE
jgi:2'-5' RNA ligase